MSTGRQSTGISFNESTRVFQRYDPEYIAEQARRVRAENAARRERAERLGVDVSGWLSPPAFDDESG